MRLFYAVGNVLYFVPMAISIVIIAPMLVIAAPFTPLYWRYNFARTWTRFNLWTLRWLCGIDMDIQGHENIPDEPVIVFCKHQSTWETFYLNAYFPTPVFVAKQELLWIPIFGWSMKVLRYITVDRGARRAAIESMCRQARDRLDDGLNIIIFPEGTRKAFGDKPNYKIGGAVMAARTGAKVLPVAHDAGRCWPRSLFKKRPGTVHLRYLPVIETDGLEPQEILQRAQDAIEAEQAKLAKM